MYMYVSVCGQIGFVNWKSDRMSSNTHIQYIRMVINFERANEPANGHEYNGLMCNVRECVAINETNSRRAYVSIYFGISVPCTGEFCVQVKLYLINICQALNLSVLCDILVKFCQW